MTRTSAGFCQTEFIIHELSKITLGINQWPNGPTKQITLSIMSANGNEFKMDFKFERHGLGNRLFNLDSRDNSFQVGPVFPTK
jgi:hypothetical protein